MPAVRRKPVVVPRKTRPAYSFEHLPDALGIKPMQTITLATPEAHSVYEMVSLGPGGETQAPFAMPWEGPSDEFRAFAKKLGVELDKAEMKDAFLKDKALLEKAFLSNIVQRSPEEIAKEAEFPQRSDEWLRARAYTISASQFGAAAAHSKFQSTNKLIETKVFPKRSFEARRQKEFAKFAGWGVEHEQHAEDAFKEVFLKEKAGMFCVSHPKLCKDAKFAWTAFSPDGILHRRENEKDVVELIEYKCPAYARDAPHHPYTKEPYNVPRQYMDQMQGSMWLMRNAPTFQLADTCDRAWFVCWQPHAVHITHVPYMEEYAASIIQTTREIYFQRFVPGCVDAIHDRLKTGLEATSECTGPVRVVTAVPAAVAFQKS